MAIVLTVAPLGGSDLSDWMGGWAKRQGGEVIRVPGGADLSMDTIPETAKNLDYLIQDTLRHSKEDVIVLGHSQGCQVVGEWLREYADADPYRLRFVLTGNLERAFFGYAFNKVSWIPKGNIRGITPNDTAFKVLDIGREKDAWANFPGGLWAMLRLVFSPAHLDYSMVNPENLDIVGHKKVFNTNYVNVR